LTGTGGDSAASLLGLNARLGTVQAAMVNGASMHVLDFEPMWLPVTHALSPALAAVLALGETLGCGGAKILAAMVLGIEMQGRLRQAAGALESHELRFHPPGFVGPIGAAVAAGHLLDFDADQFANAIGIAGSRCGGLFINLGTMTKATHCAYAAALGLEAALLTRRATAWRRISRPMVSCPASRTAMRLTVSTWKECARCCDWRVSGTRLAPDDNNVARPATDD
jgi:aconitate decarboxylase